jgi:dolichol-phosphate mannosyltransferase
LKRLNPPYVSEKHGKQFFPFLRQLISFALIGGSGFFINYFLSYFLSNGIIANMWYIYASILGIGISMTSNFILNKIFTFENRNFKPADLFRQYALYIGFSILGAGIQLIVVYALVESGFIYPISLSFGVVMGSFSNFFLNKKWTFYEKIWT